MKTNHLFTGLLAAIIFCCFSCWEPHQELTDAQLKQGDSLAKAIDGIMRLADLFKTENSFPFSADTTLLYHIENCDSLGTMEVKQLAVNWFKHDLVGGTDYDLQTFYKIDSVKAAGKYIEYCDSLQIGDTKCSNAFAICKLQPDGNTNILVWALVTSSYEACPYSDVKTVYFSVVRGGIVSQTFMLGEYMVAGDAPASMERTISGKINADLTFVMNLYMEGDEDLDLPEIEITKEHYEFAIKEGKISLMMEKKNPPKKVKRKK